MNYFSFSPTKARAILTELEDVLRRADQGLAVSMSTEDLAAARGLAEKLRRLLAGQNAKEA